MGKKILHIEDEPDIIFVMKKLLTFHGFDVTSVSDSEEGLKVAFENVPDLILMDLNMPKIDGYEACRRLRADERTRSVPILMVTGAYLKDVEALCREAGANGCVSKPYEPAEFVEKVKSLISGH